MIALNLECLEARSLPSTGLLPPLNTMTTSAQVATRIAADGAAADSIAYPKNRMTAETDAALLHYQTPPRTGIIAVLIGL